MNAHNTNGVLGTQENRTSNSYQVNSQPNNLHPSNTQIKQNVKSKHKIHTPQVEEPFLFNF